MKVIICTWRIREWELQILNWSSSVQPEIVPLFTISFQCLKKKFKSWQVYDWLAKWLIMSGYMDLRRPRVYRRSNVGLVHICTSYQPSSEDGSQNLTFWKSFFFFFFFYFRLLDPLYYFAYHPLWPWPMTPLMTLTYDFVYFSPSGYLRILCSQPDLVMFAGSV